MKTLTKIGVATAGILIASKLVSAKSAKNGAETPETFGSANIQVIDGSFTVTPTVCPSTGNCILTASATWKNMGDVTGTFTPEFVFDGIAFPGSSPPNISLEPGQEYIGSVQAAVLPTADMNHKVCPSPNP